MPKPKFTTSCHHIGRTRENKTNLWLEGDTVPLFQNLPPQTPLTCTWPGRRVLPRVQHKPSVSETPEDMYLHTKCRLRTRASTRRLPLAHGSLAEAEAPSSETLSGVEAPGSTPPQPQTPLNHEHPRGLLPRYRPGSPAPPQPSVTRPSRLGRDPPPPSDGRSAATPLPCGAGRPAARPRRGAADTRRPHSPAVR